ncbi:MAG: M67 family metallopeptidase [Clostridia bacterium]|nr:M67 family metallopeptidase [Clostridia bacterium]
MLIFDKKTVKTLCLCAQAAYPEECCGILLGKREGERRTVYRVLPVENRGNVKQKTTRFRIDPLEIARIELSAERERLEIVGFYHSHPDHEAIASRTDAAYMIAGYSYPVISVRDGVCVRMACFEKGTQASTRVRGEKIIIQGECPNADPDIYISNIKNIHKSQGRDCGGGDDDP